MQREKQRLASYHDWPDWSHAQPILLASDGFFYEGEEGVVRCFSCKKAIEVSEIGHVPLEHRRLCPFTKGTDETNVPFAPTGDHTDLVADAAPNEWGGPSAVQQRLEKIHQKMPSIKEKGKRLISDSGICSMEISDRVDSMLSGGQPRRSSRSTQAKSTGTLPTPTGLDKTQLRFEEYRLETFKREWPAEFAAHSSALARCGFYNASKGEHTGRISCAFCLSWYKLRSDDRPEEVHKNFPRCKFFRGLNVGNVSLQQERQLPQSSVVEENEQHDQEDEHNEEEPSSFLTAPF